MAWSRQSYFWEEHGNSVFLLAGLSKFKVSRFIYRDLKRSVFGKRGKIWPYFMQLAGERKHEKDIFQVVARMRYYCVVYTLQLVVITPQHHTVIFRYQM